MNLSEAVGLAPVANKKYKLFLVELDDENRERVVAGLVGRCEIKHDPEYADVRVESGEFPMMRYVTSDGVKIILDMVPYEDGTYFRIEDFSKEEE